MDKSYSKNALAANVLALAVSGMLIGSVSGCASHKAKSSSTSSMAAAAKHGCKGMNACKGQGGCKSGDNGCAGKNSCKGHGGCAVK